jgi:hypothetical protein
MPKSVSLAWVPVTRMFSGLTSRCRDPLLVSVAEGVDDGDQVVDCLAPGDGSCSIEEVAEAASFDQFHDEVGQVVGGVAGVVDGDDLGVGRQSSHHPAFAFEALAVFVVESLVEDLDRHPAIESGVGGGVDHTEPAPADHLDIGEILDPQIDRHDPPPSTIGQGHLAPRP